MKINELREKSVADLKNAIGSWKADLFGYRLQLALHKLEDTAAISKTKKNIAQANTVIKEKELGIEEKNKAKAAKKPAKKVKAVKSTVKKAAPAAKKAAAKKPVAKKAAAAKKPAAKKVAAKTTAKSKAAVKKTGSKAK